MHSAWSLKRNLLEAGVWFGGKLRRKRTISKWQKKYLDALFHENLDFHTNTFRFPYKYKYKKEETISKWQKKSLDALFHENFDFHTNTNTNTHKKRGNNQQVTEEILGCALS